MPGWVAAILENRTLSLLARVLLTLMFWSSGFEKLIGFQQSIAEMNHFGLQPAILFAGATTLTLLGGSVLLIWGRWAWLGAGWLSIFTIATIPIAHAFWNAPEPHRMEMIHGVREHFSIVGGLFLAAALAHLQRRPKAS